jgi:hypothetical protein
MSIVIEKMGEGVELAWNTILKDDAKRRLEVHSAIAPDGRVFEIDRRTIKGYYTIRIDDVLQMKDNGETIAYFILKSAKKFCDRKSGIKSKKVDLEKVPDLNESE